MKQERQPGTCDVRTRTEPHFLLGLGGQGCPFEGLARPSRELEASNIPAILLFIYLQFLPPHTCVYIHICFLITEAKHLKRC